MQQGAAHLESVCDSVDPACMWFCSTSRVCMACRGAPPFGALHCTHFPGGHCVIPAALQQVSKYMLLNAWKATAVPYDCRVLADGLEPFEAVANARLHHQLIPNQVVTENYTAPFPAEHVTISSPEYVITGVPDVPCTVSLDCVIVRARSVRSQICLWLQCMPSMCDQAVPEQCSHRLAGSNEAWWNWVCECKHA